MTAFKSYPCTGRLVEQLHELWPDHDAYIEKTFEGRTPDVMAISEQAASCALRVASGMKGGLVQLCEDYRFLCEDIVLPEELYFRRHNRYRLASFADAMRECYSKGHFMARYMNGLLLSNVLWKNHALAIASFALDYLPSLKPDSGLLEIGPGHGLFLYFAATSPRVGSAQGWDISPSSIERTRAALDILGVRRPVRLTLQDLFDAKIDPDGPRFDAIVMSEILEHLESPIAALRSASAWLRPGGTMWINVPANSPAPDHIFLVESPEHACDLVSKSGLKIVACHAFPMTGCTLERARKGKLAISCVIVGQSNDSRSTSVSV